jgi:Rps23 Pro-64 3,4-dihydroxylase Tpa1-like proline 4-hydroxylase
MKIINYPYLESNKSNLIEQWNNPENPFKFLVFDGFLLNDITDDLIQEYPHVNKEDWDNRTFINQKNKFSKNTFLENEPLLNNFFKEVNSPKFINLISEITGIENLLADDELFGGGLHQSINGAFLDVHVDFNIHPKTNFHRRLNLIVYLNKNWEESFNGYLELWDMKNKKQIANIKPCFDRFVIFETNEISFHGHPKKLNTPLDVSRKSLAVYYYTKNRDENEIAEEHNTIYINTEGFKGKLKNAISGFFALKERIKK